MSEIDSSNGQSAESLSEDFFLFCNSDLLSEEGLREIIERYGLTHNNHGGCYYFFLAACRNERVNEGIIQCLLEYFPGAASATSDDGWTPLHFVCNNKNATLNIIQLLIDAAPDSVRIVNNKGNMPLHILCYNDKLDNITAIQILKLLVEKYLPVIRHANNNGLLPIHLASGNRSPEFCRVLIEAYPGSERIIDDNGALPLHYACGINSLATVEYMVGLFPDAVNHAANDRNYPIHLAISSITHRGDPLAAVEILQYLLECDHNVKLQRWQGRDSLLQCACENKWNDSTIEPGIQIIKVIYDSHP